MENSKVLNRNLSESISSPDSSTAERSSLLENNDKGFRIMSIMAHADDAEIWAGGTIINHTERGDKGLLCIFADKGSDRIAEAEEGAKRLGCGMHVISCSQEEVLWNTGGAIQAQLLRVLLEFNPHILLTHWSGDSHPEHRRVSEFVHTVISSSPHLRVTSLKCIYMCSTYNFRGKDQDFHPDLFVDISVSWSRKVNAISAHCSQTPERWIALAHRQDRIYGARCEVEYAEGFKRSSILGRDAVVKYLI